MNFVDPLDETKAIFFRTLSLQQLILLASYAISKGSVGVRFLTEEATLICKRRKTSLQETRLRTKYTSEAPAEITKDGRIYHPGWTPIRILRIKWRTVTKGMKTVIYDYKLVTGTVIARFVIQDTSTELQPELAVATNVDNGTHYIASAPDEISSDGPHLRTDRCS